MHQPTVWPVPHACAQPYHPGSGSHGRSSAWHSYRVYKPSQPVRAVTISGYRFRALWLKPKQNNLGQETLEIGKSWTMSLMTAICDNRSKQNSVINDFKGRQHRYNSFICSIQVLTLPHSEQVKRILPSTNSSFHHHFIIINIDFSMSLLSAHWNFIPFTCL